MTDIVTTTKVVITAEDKTGAGFTSAAQNAKKASSAFDELAQRYGAAQASMILRAQEAERAFAGQIESMQRARAEVGAMQRALDSLGGGNRDIARAILGTRGTNEIQNEIKLITSALDRLRASAGIGPQELARASAAAQQKLAALRAELAGVPQQMGAIGTAAGPLPALFKGMLAPLAALATFEGLRRLATEFVRLADANTLLQARLKAVVGSVEGGKAAFAGLVADAARLRVPLEDAGRGFTRIASAVLELGGTVVQARQLNEVVLATAKIMGTAPEEAAAAARQFAQALGSGVLQGDELRSILENNQELARQLAQGLGVSIGELRKLGSEGKLTADVVANALLERLPEIQKRLRDVPITVADAFTLLANETFSLVGAFDNATGSSSALAGALTSVAGGVGAIREQFASGSITKGLASIAALQAGTLLAPGAVLGGLNLLGKSGSGSPAVNLRAIENEMEATAAAAEKSALGVAAAAKRAYEDAIKVGGEFLTKQQKIAKEFGSNMQLIAKAIEAQQKIVNTAPAGSAERAAAVEKITELERLRAAGMADVAKKIAEANAADAKRSPIIKELTAQQKAYNAALEQVANIADSAREALDGLFANDALTKAEVALRKIENSDAWAKLSEGQKQYIADTLSAAAETERLTARLKEQARAAGDFAAGRAKEYADWEKEVSKATDSFDDLIAKLNAETDALEYTGNQRERHLALLKLEQQMNDGLIPSMDEYIRRLDEINAAFDRRDAAQSGRDARQDAIKAEQKAYQDLYNWIDQQTTALWAAVTEKGGNAWEKITEVFKNTLLAAIYKLAVQPIVFNIVASVTGIAAPGSGIAGGIGSLFGGGSGGLGGIFSGLPGLSSLFGGGFGAALGGGFSAGLETLSLAATAGLQAIGGLSSALGALGAVAGPVGAAIAGIALAASFLKKVKKGGFSSLGDIAGISGTDSSGRYFTPNQSDSELAKTLDAVNKGYLEITRQLGLTARDIGFALGFDTDPKGSAPNRVHAGTFVGGAQIYDAALGDLGRDEKALQEALATEAKRILFAAIQASLGDAPNYLRELLRSVDAATASAEEIDRVLATAQALKTAVDTVAGLGDKFAALDAAQIQSLVDAFGGLEKFTSSAAFINENFTSSAEKAAAATKRASDALDAGFAGLNLQVPKTHQAFTDLLASFDLTTEEGRDLYASVSALAPAFVAVAGSAEEAAQKLASAQAYFDENFYSEQERAQMSLLQGWDEVHAAWTKFGAQLHELGYDHIPTTIQGFRNLINTLRAMGLNDLADQLIGIAPAIIKINDATEALTKTADEAAEALNRASRALGSLAQASLSGTGSAGTIRGGTGGGTVTPYGGGSLTSRGGAPSVTPGTSAGYEIVDVGSLYGSSAAGGGSVSPIVQELESIWGAVQRLINESQDGFGEKLAMQLKLIPEQLAKVDAAMAAAVGDNATTEALRQLRSKLDIENAKAAASLARFTVLTAQYGEAKAEELVQLEDWYREMAFALGGSTEALASLQTIFDQRWQAIIDGTAQGVDGTLSELDRLRQNIRNFLDSLKLSDLSPLTPAQKLAEAQSQYQSILARAQGGDVEALGQITQSAQEYLRLAQQFFGGSTGNYGAIFTAVTTALEALTIASEPPVTETAANTALVAALPAGKLASSDDVKALAVEVVQAVNALALSNKADSQAEQHAIAGGVPGPVVI